MLGVILLVLAAIFLGCWLLQVKVTGTKRPGPARLTQAEGYATRLFREKHYLPAEKAYLDVLKLDHRNANAYTHLGLIYTIQHNFSDAIEAFELAARYSPTAVAYQHLASAYYENKNLVKSVAAYEKSIMFEPSASRYAGLSKSFDRLGSGRKAMDSIQKAIELDDLPRYRTELTKLRSSYGHGDSRGANPDRSGSHA